MSTTGRDNRIVLRLTRLMFWVCLPVLVASGLAYRFGGQPGWAEWVAVVDASLMLILCVCAGRVVLRP